MCRRPSNLEFCKIKRVPECFLIINTGFTSEYRHRLVLSITWHISYDDSFPTMTGYFQEA